MKIVEQKVRQTKTGQDYKVFKLENGKYLSVFQFDSRYKDLEVGMDLSEDLLVYDESYGNYKLKPLARPTTFVKGPSGYKGVQMEKAMETKKENIEEAQTRKHDAIALAAAQRDAVLMVTTFEVNQPFPTDAELRAKIVEWRDWFLKEHANRSSQPF